MRCTSRTWFALVLAVVVGHVACACEDEPAKDTGSAQSESPAPEPAPSQSREAAAREAAERASAELARLGTPLDLAQARPHFSVFAEQFRAELASRDLDTVRSNLVTEPELGECTLPGDVAFPDWHAKVLRDIDEIVGRGWTYLAVERLPELSVQPHAGEHAYLGGGEACAAAFIAQATFVVVLDNDKEPHALRLQPTFALIGDAWRFVGRRFSGDSLDCADENKDEAVCAIWRREH